MSDDLAKRLRGWARDIREGYPSRKREGSTAIGAMAQDLKSAALRIEELEAKLAKAVTRLQHIAANKTTGELTVIEWDTYDMFTILDACISEARTTLAELKGGKDE